MTQQLDLEDTVFARRILRDSSTGSTLELVLYQPEPDPNSPHSDWLCRVEIRESGASTRSLEGHGVDSLQALVSAISALRHGLRQDDRRTLTWLGRPGEVGLPLVVQEDDQDFLVLIEQLISAEHSRQIITRKHIQQKGGQ